MARQSAQRGFGAPKKHMPGKKVVKKKLPESTVYTSRGGGVRIPLSRAAAEIRNDKRGKFTKSEVMPAYNSSVAPKTQKNILAKKKRELQAQMEKLERQEKQLQASSKNLGGSVHKKLPPKAPPKKHVSKKITGTNAAIPKKPMSMKKLATASAAPPKKPMSIRKKAIFEKEEKPKSFMGKLKIGGKKK